MAVLLGAISDKFDKHLVNETISFAENDERCLYILENVYVPAIKKKIKSGKYDSKKAVKLLEYFYSNYVRPEMKKPSKYGYDPKLNPKERIYFSEYFVDLIESSYL